MHFAYSKHNGMKSIIFKEAFLFSYTQDISSILGLGILYDEQVICVVVVAAWTFKKTSWKFIRNANKNSQPIVQSLRK